MTLADLIGDTAVIGRMSDADFEQYWEALGKVVRLASRASTEEPAEPDEPARGEVSTTSAVTQIATPQRDWRRPRVTAGTPFGFTGRSSD